MKKNIISIVIFLVGLGTAVRLALGVVRLAQSGRRIDVTQKELAEAKEENSRLKNELQRVSGDTYILGEAKEKLGLGEKGEVVVILPQEQIDSSQLPISDQVKVANWRLWWNKWVRI
jgi:cell division protein FtsB